MRKRVFVIDDDRIYQFAIKWHVQKMAPGAEVAQFLNGQSGLDVLTSLLDDPSLLPDVILLDINMPGMDGWEFIDHLAAIGNEHLDRIDVFMVSSSIDRSDIEKAKQTKGIKNYIIKPVSDEDLGKVLNLEQTING
jgi:CheY-like chemotaxis protein